jgi:SAM-dependent methyltransferase
MKLHLGCGRTILSGWTNLDCVALPGVDVVADLEACATTPLPFADDSVDEIFGSHVIEHIRNILPLMQELWRVAKPGATMIVRVPHGASDDAWEDPTHVRAFFPQSFGYYSQPYYWRADYGYRGDWQPEKIVFYPARQLPLDELVAATPTQRNIIREMVATLTAVKPAREPRRDLQRLPQMVFG